jgi:hypothetical protein
MNLILQLLDHSDFRYIRLKYSWNSRSKSIFMKAKAMIGITALILAILLAFVPASVAFQSAPSSGPGPCSVTWFNPKATYTFGSSVRTEVTATCEGIGDWILTAEPSGALILKGSFSCTSVGCGFRLLLFSESLAPGSYQYSADFNGASFSFSWTQATFTITQGKA